MLSSQEFYTLCHRSDIKLIESTAKGPKVFETAQGEMIKIFRGKGRFSSNRYKPYAIRFCQHTNQLRALGFVAPQVSTIQHCPELDIYLVYYPKIPGEGALYLAKKSDEQILSQVIKFVSTLHQKGVFFRAIHLANLLRQADDQFALIDVADMQFKKKSLSFYMRYRNLKHLFSHKGDHVLWAQLGVHHWLKRYGEFAELPAYQKKILHFAFKSR